MGKIINKIEDQKHNFGFFELLLSCVFSPVSMSKAGLSVSPQHADDIISKQLTAMLITLECIMINLTLYTCQLNSKITIVFSCSACSNMPFPLRGSLHGTNFCVKRLTFVAVRSFFYLTTVMF